MTSIPRRVFLSGVLNALVAAACRSKQEASSNDAAPIGPLLAPGVLATRIDDIKVGKIAVFYVGPDALFEGGHVPGARKMAPLESEEGRRALAEVLARVPAETEVVLYCGCCPVKSCPNVRPASAAVRALHRANAYVLDLPTRFTTDWVEKGYPVERG